MHYYIHVLPGYIRVRASALKKNQPEASFIKECLKTLHGIHSVNLNLHTGCILIHYDRKGVTSRKILKQLAQNGFKPGLTVNKNPELTVLQETL